MLNSVGCKGGDRDLHSSGWTEMESKVADDWDIHSQPPASTKESTRQKQKGHTQGGVLKWVEEGPWRKRRSRQGYWCTQELEPAKHSHCGGWGRP